MDLLGHGKYCRCRECVLRRKKKKRNFNTDDALKFATAATGIAIGVSILGDL